jgi:hypothetical protein
MIGVDHEPPLIQQMQHLCVPSEFTDACNQAELGIEGELEAGNVLRLSDLQQVRTPRYRVGGNTLAAADVLCLGHCSGGRPVQGARAAAERGRRLLHYPVRSQREESHQGAPTASGLANTTYLKP